FGNHWTQVLGGIMRKLFIAASIVLSSSMSVAACLYQIQFNLSDNVEYQHRQCVDEIKVTQLDDYRYRVSFQDLVPMTKIPMRRINYFLNGDSQRFSEMKNYF